MSIQIKEVKQPRDLRLFIKLPAKIHRNHANWVPPIYADDRLFFNPRKNSSFLHCHTILLLAYKDGTVVGRIMGIINEKYNEIHNVKEGRFFCLETFEDYEVAEALIKYTEKWGKEKGMMSMVGPLGFSDKDPQGLLVEGYNEPVVIATHYNFPYMVDFVEKAGYGKKTDLVVYKLSVPEIIPDFYSKLQDRALRNNHTKLITFSSRREMKVYIRPVCRLVNETYADIYAFSPLTEKEMDEFANRFIFLLNPKYCKVIENDHKMVVAFVIGMLDISEGLRKSKGYLLPFGIFRLLLSQRKTRQLNLLMGAIHPDYRNGGLDAIMAISMLEEAKKAGLHFIDSHLELETNIKMRAEMERLGGVVYKRYRIFGKAL